MTHKHSQPPQHIAAAQVELTGCFVVLSPECGHPLLVQIPGIPQECVPVFTSLPRMRRALRELGVGAYTHTRITNEDQFVQRVPAKYAIVVDMHRAEGGTQYTLLDRKGSMN